MVTQFVATNIQSALEVLATERERTTAEQEAFAAFHDYITDIKPSQDYLDGGHGPLLGNQPILQSQSDNRLQHVREAYRESIMNLPHYDDEYHDSLSESLARELCPEIASALTTGTQFTPPLHTQLINETQEAKAKRTDFLKTISRETEHLQSGDEQITAIGSDLNTLDADSLETWTSAELTESRDQLLAAEERCEQMATARQSTLQTSRTPGPTPADLDLSEYLYHSLPVTYPVLADLADMADTLGIERSRVDRALERTENRTSSTYILHP